MSLELNIRLFRLGRPGIRKVLGDLETEIMELMWMRPAEQGTTVRDIFEILYPQRHLAYTTIMSTMSRLAKKQLLAVEKREQTYLYTPTITKQALISYLINRIVDDLLIGFMEGGTAERGKGLDAEMRGQLHQVLEEITQTRMRKDGPSCT